MLFQERSVRKMVLYYRLDFHCIHFDLILYYMEIEIGEGCQVGYFREGNNHQTRDGLSLPVKPSRSGCLPYHFGQITMHAFVLASLHQTEYQISDELWCKSGAPDFYAKSPSVVHHVSNPRHHFDFW